MMKRQEFHRLRKTILWGVTVVTAMQMGCSSDSEPVPVDCTANGPQLTVQSTTPADCGQQNGSIVLSATGGNGNLQFSIGSAFQTAGAFDDLDPGNYVAQVRDDEGCTASMNITVAALPSGVSFSETIAPIVESKCAITGCHVAGTGLPDYTIFSQFQSRAAGVKSRTQSGDMPRTGSLTDEQIAFIACWVDDGALDN